MWVEAGFPPETFGIQTERSFSNALAGVARHRIKLAWQIAIFTGLASVGKLKTSPDDYMPADDSRNVTPGSMKLIGYMRRLQHRGVPVRIERIERIH
jgi:hypothetical protein